MQKTRTFEEIAEICNVDAAYLSQIATEYIGKSRKNPRKLSDAYASKIEEGLNLPVGWFDRPDDYGLSPSQIPEIANDTQGIYSGSPHLLFIGKLHTMGQLSDEALEALAAVARHMAHATALPSIIAANGIADHKHRRQASKPNKNGSTGKKNHR